MSSVRAPSRAATGSVYRRKRERLFKILSSILIICAGLMLIFELFSLGFKRDYLGYGSGIWVGLPTIAFGGLTLASINRGRQFQVAVLACGAVLLAVLAGGLAVAAYELSMAMMKLYDMRNKQGGSTNDCGSCGELVMTKAAFQLVVYLMSAIFVCLIIYRLSVKLCACCQPSPEEASKNSLTKSAIDMHNHSIRGSMPPSVYAPSVRSYAQSQVSQSVPDLYQPQPRAPSQSASQYDARAGAASAAASVAGGYNNSGSAYGGPPAAAAPSVAASRQGPPSVARFSTASQQQYGGSQIQRLALQRYQPPAPPPPPPQPQVLQAQPVRRQSQQPVPGKKQSQVQPPQPQPPPQVLQSQGGRRPGSGYRQHSSSGKRVPRN